jgi:hypothetical protein
MSCEVPSGFQYPALVRYAKQSLFSFMPEKEIISSSVSKLQTSSKRWAETETLKVQPKRDNRSSAENKIPKVRRNGDTDSSAETRRPKFGGKQDL